LFLDWHHPDEQWEKRDETPVPANHMATFLPDLSFYFIDDEGCCGQHR
jgi:hypothetical protein